MRARIALVFFALLLLGAGTAFYVLAYTRTGVALALAQLDRLESIEVRVEGVSGRLTGPLRIARLEIDHERARLVAHDIAIDLHLRWLALQTIDVTALRASRISIELKQAPDKPPPETPLRFLPGFLSLSIEAAELDDITLRLAGGQRLAAQRVEAAARLNSSRLQVEEFTVTAPDIAARGTALLTAARPLGLEVTARGTYRDGERPDLELALAIKGNADTLQLDADVQAPVAAQVRSVLTRPRDAWRLDGRINADAFPLAPWVPGSPVALNGVALEFSAQPELVRVSGRLTVPAVDPAPFALEASGRYTERTLVLTAASVTQPESPLRVNLEGRVAFTGGAPALNLAATWQSLSWPLSARMPRLSSPTGRLTVSGPSPYRFSASATVTGPRIPTTAGLMNGSVSAETLVIDQYRLNLLEGSISGAGTLALVAPRRWALSATAAGLNPAAVHAAFPGKIDFAATASGTDVTPATDFLLTVARLKGALRQEPLAGSGTLERSPLGWRARAVDVSLGGARLTAAGTVHGAVDVNWTFAASELARLWPGAHGQVRFNGSARGPLRSPHIIADLQGSGLEFAGWTAASVQAAVDVDPAGQTPSRVKLDARNAGREALQADSIVLEGNGTPDSHTVNLQLTARGRGQRQTSAALAVRGGYANGTWTGEIASGRVVDRAGAAPLRLAQPAPVVASRERVAVGQLCLYLVDSSVCGNGGWQRGGPWQVTARGEAVPLNLIGELLPDQPRYLGTMDLSLTAQGSPAVPWRGDASVVVTGGAIEYLLAEDDIRTTETVQIGSGRVDVQATADTVSVVAGLAGAAESYIAANATLTRLPGVSFGDTPLAGSVRARMGDANLLPLLVAEVDHAAGVLTADVALSGQVGAPRVNGRIDLARGELDLYRLNLALRQIELGLRLAGNRLQFAGTGLAGEGSWNAGGTLAWRNGLPAGTLTLKGENLLVADLPEYRVIASPDLGFNIDGRRIEASGEVLIPSALIQPRDLSGAVQISPDSRLESDETNVTGSRFTIASDIRIRLGDDVQLDTFGLQGKLGGSVATIVRPGEIAMGNGELTVADGKYEAYGQKLDISRGRLLFGSSPLDDPGLDIQAERTIETTKVGLNVRGTLRDPRFGFYSEPAMSQTQVLSYLLVGKPLDDLQNRDAAAVGSARDSLALQGGGILAAQLGRRLGLGEVGVESQGGNQTALVLGRFLSPRLYVSYGISLTESINTLKLRYTISNRWVLKTEAGENQSADVEFTIERP